jgi:hypothetical protein
MSQVIDIALTTQKVKNALQIVEPDKKDAKK